MKKIRLCEEDFVMFDDEISPSSYEYFIRHKDAFRGMWQDQGRKFWSRFVYCFKSFTLNHGAMKDFPAKPEHYEGIVEDLFKYIYSQFVTGKFSQAKNLIMDIVTVAQSRHLIQFLESRSFAKDPFYHKDTREVYRRLFGPPGEKESLLKVYFFLTLYLKFGGSVVTCLREWVGADLCASDDESYWHGPNMESIDSPITTSAKDSGKTRTKLKPVSILSESFILTEDGQVMFTCEMMHGDPRFPKFILEWNEGDPRPFEHPENPLYDKHCDLSEDWRTGLTKLMYMRFLIFAKNYLKKKGEDKNPAPTFLKVMDGKGKSGNGMPKKNDTTKPADVRPKSVPKKGKSANGNGESLDSAVKAQVGKSAMKSSAKCQTTEVQTGKTDMKHAQTQCEPLEFEPRSKQQTKMKKSGGNCDCGKGQSCCHKVDAGGDRPVDVTKKSKDSVCPKSGKKNEITDERLEKIEKASWEKTLNKLDDIWKMKVKSPKNKGAESTTPKSLEMSCSEELSLRELCEKAKWENYELDFSMRSLLPGKLIPDDFRVVHAEFLQPNAKKIEKRIRLLAINQEGIDGKEMKQLTYTISFPKLKLGSIPAQPEVHIDGGVVKVIGPRGSREDDDDAPDEEKDGSVESLEEEDQKPVSKVTTDDKQNSSAENPKCPEPEKWYSNCFGGSLKDMDLDKDMEGATGGGLKILECLPVLKDCRICTTCLRPEPRPKTYKKCQKCKDENVKEPRYYCGRDCQTIDWKNCHKREHKEGLLSL